MHHQIKRKNQKKINGFDSVFPPLSMHKMVRKVDAETGIVEEFTPMTKNYWKRNKMPNINITHDSPFALDRQLEDQKFLQTQNRNPRLLLPTKVDKDRSHTIIAKKGASRAVAVKANVLNKIVREASGMHTYALVPPPRSVSAPECNVSVDPETHPAMRPYAKEANIKPQMCSFGHRPNSASRLFHPATMKIRLESNEIVKNKNNRTGFGLPVTILQQLLHAPKLNMPNEESLFNNSESLDLDKFGNVMESSSDVHNLFGDLASTDFEDSAGRVNLHSKRHHPKKSMRKLEPVQVQDDRPGWNEGFQCIRPADNEKFNMRVSGINSREPLPLQERLTRFAQLAVAESQILPFCSERQLTDKKVLAGTMTEPVLMSPVKGQKVYYDPLDVQLKAVRAERAITQKAKEDKHRALDYQRNLVSIPDSKYFPTTELAKLHRAGSLKSTGVLSLSTASMALDLNQSGSWKSKSLRLSPITRDRDQLIESCENCEPELTGAMQAAQGGSTTALHNYFSKPTVGSEMVRTYSSSLTVMQHHGSTGSLSHRVKGKAFPIRRVNDHNSLAKTTGSADFNFDDDDLEMCHIPDNDNDNDVELDRAADSAGYYEGGVVGDEGGGVSYDSTAAAGDGDPDLGAQDDDEAAGDYGAAQQEYAYGGGAGADYDDYDDQVYMPYNAEDSEYSYQLDNHGQYSPVKPVQHPYEHS